jgi:hypothetical protein
MRRLLLALTLALAAPTASSAEPPTTHEIIYTRPSGFWTSNRPAPNGGEYKWRLMEVGLAVGLITGLLLARAIRRANKFRTERAVLPEARTETRKPEPPAVDIHGAEPQA